MSKSLIQTVCVLLLLLGGKDVFSQSTDSLEAMRCFAVFQEYEYLDPSKAKLYIDSGFLFANKSRNNYVLGKGHQFRGWYFQDVSEFEKAKDHFFLSLSYFKKANDPQGIADAYGNIGNVFYDIEEYSESIEYQLKSLKKNEKIIVSGVTGSQLNTAMEGRTYALHNVASIYGDLELFDRALEFEHKSLKHELEADNQPGVAISYHALATIHKELSHYDSAEYYFLHSLAIYKKYPQAHGEASSYSAYASMKESSLTQSERAKMHQAAMEIFRSLGDVDGEVNELLDLGNTHYENMSADSLSHILDNVKNKINEYNLDHHLQSFYRLKAHYYEKVDDAANAYLSMKEYLNLLSESEDEKRSHDIIAGDVKYEMQKKMINDSLQLVTSHEMERAIDEKKIADQRSLITLGALGGMILIVFLIWFIQANKRKRKTNQVLSEKNDEINHQREVVEAKNRSISDSIQYAQRLQRAIIPSRQELQTIFPNYALFYQPKDIVSGDFYWMHVLGDVIYIAVADCTGHGVPGAIVSVVCSNAMNRVVNDGVQRSTGEILDEVRKNVLETFLSDTDKVRDGMDITLCAVDRAKGEVMYSGANNPLWIVRKKIEEEEENVCDRIVENDGFQLLEFKGDKQPIGSYPNQQPFASKRIQVKKDDTFYLFSDGYIDQFGGRSEKKMKSGGFKQILLDLADKDLSDQEKYIGQAFNDWKGELEQVDDVCVLAFRL